jgi:oxygen-independent coproporphyrinogen-3 oxidase
VIDTGIYIHIPFCFRKCSYCDFYSMPPIPGLINEYVGELKREIILNSQKHRDKRIDTIYLGGGTPSILDIKDLETILSVIYSNYSCQIKEATIEVNPCSSKNIDKYKDIGINRISIGVQSLDDKVLKVLARSHTPNDALQALENASKYFDNISADFILGVTDSSDINTLFEKPYIVKNILKHISAYILKIEKGTPLRKKAQIGEYKPLDDDELAKAYQNAYQAFQENEFYRYEISNFAKKGYECLHNLKYWNMSPYLGFGVNAHSFVDGKRYHNKKSLNNYLKGEHSGTGKQVYQRTDEFTETIMLALRTAQGLDIKKLNKNFQIDFLTEYKPKLEKLKDYLIISDGFLRIKDEFFLVQNSITARILY